MTFLMAFGPFSPEECFVLGAGGMVLSPRNPGLSATARSWKSLPIQRLWELD